MITVKKKDCDYDILPQGFEVGKAYLRIGDDVLFIGTNIAAGKEVITGIDILGGFYVYKGTVAFFREVDLEIHCLEH